jgi:hypothetical protein
MALYFDSAFRFRSNSVKTPGPYGYPRVVVHRSASLHFLYSFKDGCSMTMWQMDIVHNPI